MSLILRSKVATRLPVEGEELSPSVLSGLSAQDAARRPILVGNTAAELGDQFEIEESAAGAADVVELVGDLGHVRSLGRGLDRGTLIVRGDAGAYLGAGMTGGSIEVTGNVGDWAGADMRGGLLTIRGDTGRYLGASFPGGRLGMRDGVILVHGACGEQAGRRMRRGLIAVAGAVGACFGRGMIAGTLFAFGPAGRFAGAGMKRGTIGLFDTGEEGLLPTFEPAGRYRFPFLTIYLRRLVSLGFPVPGALFTSLFERYNGDRAEGGQGEVLTGQDRS